MLLDTTMLLPISSHTATERSRKTFPFPFSSTSTAPNKPRGESDPWTWSFRLSQMLPVEAGPCEMSPVSRTVAQYLPGDKPLRVRSTIVRLRETWTIRASPRIGFDTVVACVSNIHTDASAHKRMFINKCSSLIENKTWHTVRRSAAPKDSISTSALYGRDNA